MTFETLLALLRLTLSNPRAAARTVMAQHLSLGTAWTGLLLVSVVSAVLGYLGFVMVSTPQDPMLSTLFGSPFNTAVFQIIVQALTGIMAWAVGRKFRGTGSLPDALALVAWVQVPLILLQALQLVAMTALPPLAPLMGLVGLALYAVLLSLFVAELHGFKSGFVVFFGILASSFIMAVIAAFAFAFVFGVAHV